MPPSLSTYLVIQQQNLHSHPPLRLTLKIIPNAKQTEWKELMISEHETLIKLKVAAVPEKGKANQIIENFVSKFFGAPAVITSGHTSAIKRIQVGRVAPKK